MLSKVNIVLNSTPGEYTDMDLHLGTRDDIAALLQIFEPVPKRGGRASHSRKAAQAREQVERGIGPKLRNRCRCGSCRSCQENARWERIYNEKFADPMYYTPRVPSLGSTLATVCR
jgi:hypothetical protein